MKKDLIRESSCHFKQDSNSELIDTSDDKIGYSVKKPIPIKKSAFKAIGELKYDHNHYHILNS